MKNGRPLPLTGASFRRCPPRKGYAQSIPGRPHSPFFGQETENPSTFSPMRYSDLPAVT